MIRIHAQTPRLVTGPAETPVSLAEAKAHLRVEHDDDDTTITALVAAATAHLDGWAGILGLALVTQTWAQDWPAFPARLIPLPLAPVLTKSAVTITYLDTLGLAQTLDDDLYHLVRFRGGPAIMLDDDADWPDTVDRPDAVSVQFVCGYGAASAVPAAIRHALLLLVGHWYEHREAAATKAATELPIGVQALIAPYRRVGV